MNVTVMGRRNAVLYCGQKNPDKSVMISISDPRMVYDSEPFVSAENGILAILPLSFSDADGEGLDVYGNCVDESNLMTDEDARKVAEFVEAHRDVYIPVHCDARAGRPQVFEGCCAGCGGVICRSQIRNCRAKYRHISTR